MKIEKEEELIEEIKNNRKKKEELLSRFDLTGFTDYSKEHIKEIIEHDYFWIDKELRAELKGYQAGQKSKEQELLELQEAYDIALQEINRLRNKLGYK